MPRQQGRTDPGDSSAMANLLQAIKHDKDLTRRLTHPELYPPQAFKSSHNYAENIA